MKMFWRKKQEEEFDDWQYPFKEEKKDHAEVKKCAAALFFFCAFYGMKEMDTPAGEFIERHARQIVTEYTDLSFFAERFEGALPKDLGGGFARRVQSVLARPADPRRYMQAPVDGAAIVSFDAEKRRDGMIYDGSFGETIKAAGMGNVEKISADERRGRFLVIDHGQDLKTVYGYMGEIFVAEGERVVQGQSLGRMGLRPADEQPGLYFELTENGVPQNPLTRLRVSAAAAGGDA